VATAEGRAVAKETGKLLLAHGTTTCLIFGPEQSGPSSNGHR
jgi:hypothetical protein